MFARPCLNVEMWPLCHSGNYPDRAIAAGTPFLLELREKIHRSNPRSWNMDAQDGQDAERQSLILRILFIHVQFPPASHRKANAPRAAQFNSVSKTRRNARSPNHLHEGHFPIPV
jgi:hypothetical protein